MAPREFDLVLDGLNDILVLDKDQTQNGESCDEICHKRHCIVLKGVPHVADIQVIAILIEEKALHC
jgi:hypothetical protein